MDPGDEAVDVVDGQARLAAHGGGVGSHVGAFQHDGADLRATRREAAGGGRDIGFRGAHVEPGLVADQHAGEFAPAFRAFDRRVGGRADGGEMVVPKALAADRHHAGPLSGREHAVERRHLHQGR